MGGFSFCQNIDCEVNPSINERNKLEGRMYWDVRTLIRNNISPYKICEAINYVCNNPDDYCCLQCYDELEGDYKTNECSKKCEGKARRTYCFDFGIKEKYLVITEVNKDKVTIVTFFLISRTKDFINKCSNKFILI